MRIQLATDLVSRNGSVDRDAKMLNAFAEGTEIIKRPAVNSVLATASGTAQGMQPNGVLIYMINGDTLRSYNSSFVLQETIVL